MTPCEDMKKGILTNVKYHWWTEPEIRVFEPFEQFKYDSSCLNHGFKLDKLNR